MKHLKHCGVDKILHIPSIKFDCTSLESYREFLHDLQEWENKSICGFLPFLNELSNPDFFDPKDICMSCKAVKLLPNKGFFVKLVRAHKLFVSPEKWYSNWGFTNSLWIFATDMRHMDEQLLIWSKNMDKLDFSRSNLKKIY